MFYFEEIILYSITCTSTTLTDNGHNGHKSNNDRYVCGTNINMMTLSHWISTHIDKCTHIVLINK